MRLIAVTSASLVLAGCGISAAGANPTVESSTRLTSQSSPTLGSIESTSDVTWVSEACRIEALTVRTAVEVYFATYGVDPSSIDDLVDDALLRPQAYEFTLRADGNNVEVVPEPGGPCDTEFHQAPGTALTQTEIYDSGICAMSRIQVDLALAWHDQQGGPPPMTLGDAFAPFGSMGADLVNVDVVNGTAVELRNPCSPDHVGATLNSSLGRIQFSAAFPHCASDLIVLASAYTMFEHLRGEPPRSSHDLISTRLTIPTDLDYRLIDGDFDVLPSSPCPLSPFDLTSGDQTSSDVHVADEPAPEPAEEPPDEPAPEPVEEPALEVLDEPVPEPDSGSTAIEPPGAVPTRYDLRRSGACASNALKAELALQWHRDNALPEPEDLTALFTPFHLLRVDQGSLTLTDGMIGSWMQRCDQREIGLYLMGEFESADESCARDLIALKADYEMYASLAGVPPRSIDDFGDHALGELLGSQYELDDTVIRVAPGGSCPASPFYGDDTEYCTTWQALLDLAIEEYERDNGTEPASVFDLTHGYLEEWPEAFELQFTTEPTAVPTPYERCGDG